MFTIGVLAQYQVSSSSLGLTGSLWMALADSSSNKEFSFSSSQPGLSCLSNWDTTRQEFLLSCDLGTGLKFGRSGTHRSSNISVSSQQCIILQAPAMSVALAVPKLFHDQDTFFTGSAQSQFLLTLYFAFRTWVHWLSLLFKIHQASLDNNPY